MVRVAARRVAHRSAAATGRVAPGVEVRDRPEGGVPIAGRRRWSAPAGHELEAKDRRDQDDAGRDPRRPACAPVDFRQLCLQRVAQRIGADALRVVIVPIRPSERGSRRLDALETGPARRAGAQVAPDCLGAAWRELAVHEQQEPLVRQVRRVSAHRRSPFASSIAPATSPLHRATCRACPRSPGSGDPPPAATGTADLVRAARGIRRAAAAAARG